MLLLFILHISHFNYFNPGGYVVVVRKIRRDRELFGFRSDTTDFWLSTESHQRTSHTGKWKTEVLAGQKLTPSTQQSFSKIGNLPFQRATGTLHFQSNFFHFHAVLGRKLAKIIDWRPYNCGWRPSYGKCWICHCLLNTLNMLKSIIAVYVLFVGCLSFISFFFGSNLYCRWKLHGSKDLWWWMKWTSTSYLGKNFTIVF